LSSLTKILILVGVILAIGAGLVVWKAKVGGHHEENLNSISRQEMELLLKDANPMMLKRLAEDPELKKKQAENLKQLLALASQAQKDGLDKDPSVQQELKNIEAELIAVNYDREINKDKGSMPPFGFITEEQVKQFWEEGHEAEFKKFIDTKINLMKASNPEMKDREISEEEMEQAKEFYAKIKIYEKEYKDKLRAGEIGKELQEKINLQVKLQKAQFLARQYATKLGDKAEVTDEDIDKYLAAHPELDPKDKRAKAEEILNRAKSGEDFAKLANEFSTDPGNKNAEGDPQGGLYKDVQQGRMMKEFEAAALALEPGQIAPNLVETPYGYHIIKLEKKAESKDKSGAPGVTYDVRHILISTGVKDPENPMSREMPVREFVRAKLQEEKEKQILDEILANNKVEVAEDYTVPEVSPEQMQQMQQKMMQQMQMPQSEDGETEPPPAAPKANAPAKPAAKK
jgi:parvulin-like peptidyl-prolyl isomerase